ncbi:hypothetical protein [Cypionkella sp.]|uniref:hypothetical protein n=1 Tax=Cypionkella sp. TaxID=2811411 RepID=UPI003750C559
MSDKIHFRQQAKRHRDVARAYLELGDDDLLYASALRLRMAIECLAYELLQSFGDEVSQNVMETWQPNKLIKELKHIDASVDQDVSIRIGIEKTPGQAAEEMKDLGTDARLSAAWISKQWNTLSGFLHIPTIQQSREGKHFDASKILKKIREILPEIDRVLASRIFATNIKSTITVTCHCGFEIKRRESILEKELQVACANCNIILGAKKTEDQWKFFDLYHNYTCPNCKKRNDFLAKALKDRVELTCDGCGALVSIEKDWCVRVRCKPDD